MTKAPQRPEPILIAAAADLAPLEEHLTLEFAQQTGLQCKFTFGASGQLARQIEYGAPYDVFLSANEAFVTQLANSGHVDRATVVLYATGRLGLWAPKQPITSLNDLLKPSFKTIAMANPAIAPYGAAARELLKNQGLWDKLNARLVFGENVRQAFEYARSGNADAVITAWSLLHDLPDAHLLTSHTANSSQRPVSSAANKSAKQTQLATTSASDATVPAVRQAAAVVTSTKQPKAARAFLDYLLGPMGQTTLRAHGLFPPETTSTPH